jgi:transcriptional regulator with XRE-family HTH domain
VTSYSIIAYAQIVVKTKNDGKLAFPQSCASINGLQRGDERMNISATLRSLMQQRGMNLTTLAERSGLAVSSISRYLSGRQVPGAAALGRLAGALEVSTADLTGSFGAPALSAKEQFLLQLEQFKDALLKEDLGGIRDASAGVSVPVYSCVPGSKGCAELKRFLAPADVTDPKAYAIRIRNDFNSPRLQLGDVAIFSPGVPWKNGDVCAVALVDGGEHIGRVGRRGKRLVLSGIKSGSLSRTVSVDQAKAIHKLVWIKTS